MKRINFLTLLLVGVFMLTIAMPLNAQNQMTQKQQQAAGTVKDSMWNNQYSTATKLDDNSKTLNQDFQKLQDNFKTTMSLNDMSQIKNGLKQQQTMMNNMQPTMTNQQKMSDQLMAMVDKRSKANIASDSEKTLAKNLYDQSKVMNEDYKSMQNDLGNMMKMNNVSDLKQAMQQHYTTMQNMSQMMTGQQDMAGNMMAMMQSGSMGSGMMQKSRTDPPKKDTTKTDTTKTKSNKW